MKRYRVIALAFGLLLLLGLSVKFFRGGERLGSDVRMLCLSDKSLELVSVSEDRNMINKLKVSGSAKIWIPEGLGWYEVDKVSRLLKQEKREELLPFMAFYNFGFWPDAYFLNEAGEDCLSTKQLSKVMSWWEILKFKFSQDSYLVKETEVSELKEDDYELREELRRDFSETSILNNKIRVGIFNQSDEPGLAVFVGDRLDWAGVDVVSIENSEEELLADCVIRVGSLSTLENGMGQMLRNLWSCREEEKKEILGEEMEIYLNKGWAEVIKYSSYVRSL